MKNQTKTTEQKQKRENQLVFIEYEKPTVEGHFMTIMDSYRNVIGRVNKSFNEQSKKFEYSAFDHAGKPFSNGEKLWEVKNEFINNREELLKEAQERRIESKEKSKENVDKEQQQPKVDDRNLKWKNCAKAKPEEHYRMKNRHKFRIRQITKTMGKISIVMKMINIVKRNAKRS